ncbi:MAG: hypothetical protein QOD46_314 [Actinomycetota bacterium]|nr:hypothetical protein [Actinomycetota bacterium]
MESSLEEPSSPWLPLLRRLSTVSDEWLVWKNVDSALSGVGDVDSAAPSAQWPTIEGEFLEWAVREKFGPAAVCRHIPGGLNLVAFPQGAAAFLEMSVKERRIFRGSTLFVIEDLKGLSEMDERGFRRLRPGAEGLFKLVLNGTKWGGRPNWDGIAEKNIRELLAADPHGVEMAAARLFGPVKHAAIKGARAAADSRWEPRAMALVDGWFVVKGIRNPVILARRARFRFETKQSCPIVKAILGTRRQIPQDRTAWLAKVAETHDMHGMEAEGRV